MRHHSAAMSARMPALLDELAPSVVYVEAPPELAPWFQWLGHPELQAPVVLAAARPGRLGFYPFSDFSPELAAVRWAVAREVPVVAIDAPVQAVLPEERAGGGGDRFAEVLSRSGARDLADFWDQEIEGRAHDATPEALRRAGLALGWALRQAGPSASDVVRECCMRRALALAPVGSVAVVGAFHGAGLLDGPDVELELAEHVPVTSLVPYTWSLLDMRSGYPAGVRDPALQQALYEAFRDGVAPREVLGKALVEVSRDLRQQGHTGGVPDTREALRMALDLASLRGRSEPGRGELMEAIETTMARGQRLGRGVALARAMQRSLVGDRRGRIAAGTPISGLRRHLEDLVVELKLPGPGAPEKTLRLDPLRSELDRARQIALLRMRTAHVVYADPNPSVTSGETLGATWTVRWVPATAATASLSGVHGITLEMAAGGRVGARWRKLEADDALTPGAQLEMLWTAAEAGVLGEAGVTLDTLWSAEFVVSAGLVELVGALRLLARVEAGHAVGTPAERVQGADPGPLYRAGIRQIEALAGSTDADEVLAMAELVGVLRDSPLRATLERALGRLAEGGGPLMQGAASTLLVTLGEDASRFGVWVASVVAGATTPEMRAALVGRLRGALTVGAVLVEADPSILTPLETWVDEVDQAAFLERLPALRGGFDTLSPAARQRFLDDLVERYGSFEEIVAVDPALLALFAAADARAAASLTVRIDRKPDPLRPDGTRPPRGVDRWRLILGREREKLAGVAASAARSLDELYGEGKGEGSRDDGRGGGDDEAQLSVREWAGELEALFGARVRDEVLATAGERGRAAALTGLDPDEIRPSVEMLRQLLSLSGSLGEGRLEGVRRLIQRVVHDLVKELALRVKPAVSGAAIPRPTLRRTGQLDLRRTVRRNLGRVRMSPEGPVLVPETLVFKSGSQRSIDWELFLLVDVSGSMEASVLYSAMMAAILSAVPWLGVQFYAFNTDVIDLSEHVEDPLSLLLEVKIGGGTNIGRALRYAADQMEVPSRSMVIVVSDFHEGASVNALLDEVRGLVSSGAHVLGVAALDDTGAAVYHAGIASQVAAAGVPVAAVSPLELARWVGEVVHG